MYVPERTRADLRYYTALYLGMLLGSVTKALIRSRTSAPAPVEESPDAPVLPQ